MIILDLNQIMISNVLQQLGNHTNVEIEENLVRHMVLNSIRNLKTKYKSYGQFVIACDDKKYWRREQFPAYKGNRKKDREKSEIDWTNLFNTLNTIKQDLKDYFPYPIIQVDGAEADDVIGSLVAEFGVPLNSSSAEKILILSGDKDFVQLQSYVNVSQYDPIHKKNITCKDPAQFLKELVLKGDRGDGIPNVLSPDNCLIEGIRQKPLTAKKMAELLAVDPSTYDPEIRANFMRNNSLIDLTFTPKTISEAVIEQYNAQQDKPRDKLFNYFVKHKLKTLIESINEF